MIVDAGQLRGYLAALVMVLAALNAQAADDDPLIATVNGRSIHLSNVYEEIESLPLGDQVAIRQRLDSFAESLVREEILFQSMRVTDFASEPELREQIKSVVVQHLIDRHVKSKNEVTDEQVAAYYAANTLAISGDGVRASHILLQERSECDALLASIDSEQAFLSAVAERSLHKPSVERGGDIGMFMYHTGGLGFETDLFDMKPGEMKVFDSDEGCHVVRVTERETNPLPPLEDVAPRIRNLLLVQQERRLLQNLLERAGQSVKVERPSEEKSE